MPDPTERSPPRCAVTILLGFLIAACSSCWAPSRSGPTLRSRSPLGSAWGSSSAAASALLWAARAADRTDAHRRPRGVDRRRAPADPHGREHHHLPDPGRGGGPLRLEPAPRGRRGHGRGAVLWATDVLTLDEALGGFGDPTVIYIAALFVVSEALDATGVTAWVGQLLVARARVRADQGWSASIMVVCAVVTALISVNGAVAALVPVVVVIALRVRLPTSQLLMPLAFGAHAGALLPSRAARSTCSSPTPPTRQGSGGSASSSSPLAGIPLLIGTVVITLLIGDRVLPHRNADIDGARLQRAGRHPGGGLRPRGRTSSSVGTRASPSW